MRQSQASQIKSNAATNGAPKGSSNGQPNTTKYPNANANNNNNTGLSQGNSNSNLSVPKKPQFFPQDNLQQMLDKKNQQQAANTTTPQLMMVQSQSFKNKMPSSQPPNNHHQQTGFKSQQQPSQQQQQQQKRGSGQPQQLYQYHSTNVSNNNQEQQQYQQQQMQMQQQKTQQQVVKSPAKRKHKRTFLVKCEVISADIHVNLSKFLSMNVHCAVTFKNEVFKTSSQSGQKPKWNESFEFKLNDGGLADESESVIEFAVMHKPYLFGEEKVGSCLFRFHTQTLHQESQHKDSFMLKNDKDELVGRILISITITSKNKQYNGAMKDENLQEEDEGYQSMGNKRTEIIRQMTGKINSKKSRQHHHNQLELGGSRPHYQALQTQQQLPYHPHNYNNNINNTISYLNTQTNQMPRSSVTEHSIIQLISTHSSNNSIDDGAADSGQKIIIDGGQSGTNILLHGGQHIMDDDMGAIVPQQLFYANKQHTTSHNKIQGAGGHPHSKNNPPAVNTKSKNQLQQYQQYYAARGGQTEDMDPRQVQSNMMNQSRQQQQMIMGNNGQQQPASSKHHHKHHHKKRKRKNKGQDDTDEGDDVDEEFKGVNQQAADRFMEEYSQYMNQQQQLYGGGGSGGGLHSQQPISSSHSQQLLSALNNKNHQAGFDSAGGGSGSGSGQHLFTTNFNIGAGAANGGAAVSGNGGSSGSYMPMPGGGPSYFDEQHSIESLNEIQNQLMTQKIAYNSSNHLPANFYDYSEFQDIEQLRMDLNEENHRIKTQEEKLRQLFEKLKNENLKLRSEKQEIKRIKEQLRYETKKLQIQNEEFEYKKQQLERQYINLKQEKLRRGQEVRLVEDLCRQFTQAIQSTKLLQTAQNSSTAGGNGGATTADNNPNKVEEFIHYMKSVQYLMQQLLVISNAQQKNENNKSTTRIPDDDAAAALIAHQQQDSTSSCATSTGNYNFLMQANQNVLTQQQQQQQQNKKSPSAKLTYAQQHQQQMQHQQQQQLLHQKMQLDKSLNQSYTNQLLSQQQQLQQQQNLQNNNNKRQLNQNKFLLQDSNSPPRVITDVLNTVDDDDLLLDNGFMPLTAIENSHHQNNNNIAYHQFNNQQQQQYQQQMMINGKNVHQIPLLTDNAHNNALFAAEVEYEEMMMNGGFSSSGAETDQYTTSAAVKKQKTGANNNNNNKNYFANDQHELSTIIEKELTSQRRSSLTNGPTDAGLNRTGNGQGGMLSSTQPGAVVGQLFPMGENHLPNELGYESQNDHHLQRTQPSAQKESNSGKLSQTQQLQQLNAELMKQHQELIRNQKKEQEEYKQQYEMMQSQIQKEIQDLMYIKSNLQNSLQQQAVVQPQQQLQQQPQVNSMGGSQNNASSHNQDTSSSKNYGGGYVYSNETPGQLRKSQTQSQQQQHSQQPQYMIDLDEEDPLDDAESEMDDYAIDNYIQQSLKINQQKMQNLGDKEGIMDPLLQEQEYVKKLQDKYKYMKGTQQGVNQDLSQSNSNIISQSPSRSQKHDQLSLNQIRPEMKSLAASEHKISTNSPARTSQAAFSNSQYEQKQLSLSLKQQQMLRQSLNHQQMMQSQEKSQQQVAAVEESDDSMDFKPDPNFLININKNMQLNDAINKNNNNSQQNNKQMGNSVNVSGSGNNQQFAMAVQNKGPAGQLQQSHLEGTGVNVNNNFYQQQLQPESHMMMMEAYGEEEEEEEGDAQSVISQQNYQQIYDVVGHNYEQYEDENQQQFSSHPQGQGEGGHMEYIHDDEYATNSQEAQQQPNNNNEDDSNFSSQHNCGTIKKDENFQQENLQHQLIQQQLKVLQDGMMNENGGYSPNGKKKQKLPEEEMIRLINEKYMQEESNKDVSVIYRDDKIFDQPKKAVYGIQKINAEF